MEGVLSQRQIKTKENDLSEYKTSLAKKLQQAKSNLRVREIKQIKGNEKEKLINTYVGQIVSLLETYGNNLLTFRGQRQDY